MLKKIIGGLLSLAVCATANAGLVDSAVTNVTKKGSLSYLKVGKLQSTLDVGHLNFGEDNRGSLISDLGDGWAAEFYITTSRDWSKTPRCYNGTNCDTTDWYFLELDTSEVSKIYNTETQESYTIHDAWGQFGHNAGGVHVEEHDGLAGGFWLKSWSYEGNGDAYKGSGGDINFNVAKVSEPSTFALLGLGLIGLGLDRRKQAA